MPADSSAKTSDAVLLIKAKFQEYTGPDSYCEYSIEPRDGSWQKTTDSDGKPLWVSGLISLHVGTFQKDYTKAAKPPIPTTVRMLERQHGSAEPPRQAVIKFVVAVTGTIGSTYHPVGIAFLRADETSPVGVPYTTKRITPGPTQNPGQIAFGDVKINEEPETVSMQLVQTFGVHTKHSDYGTHRTYRFLIIIQEATTGKIGVIDPEIEDPNER